jgi:hypothetical protein
MHASVFPCGQTPKVRLRKQESDQVLRSWSGLCTSTVASFDIKSAPHIQTLHIHTYIPLGAHSTEYIAETTDSCSVRV